jgi:hypothetical protein
MAAAIISAGRQARLTVLTVAVESHRAAAAGSSPASVPVGQLLVPAEARAPGLELDRRERGSVQDVSSGVPLPAPRALHTDVGQLARLGAASQDPAAVPAVMIDAINRALDVDERRICVVSKERASSWRRLRGNSEYLFDHTKQV